MAVEVNDNELQLLHGELLSNARPRANAKGNERVGVPSFAFLVLWVEPLGSEDVWVRKLLWICGKHTRRQPHPCALQVATTKIYLSATT